jgi:hypothetical protein
MVAPWLVKMAIAEGLDRAGAPKELKALAGGPKNFLLDKFKNGVDQAAGLPAGTTVSYYIGGMDEDKREEGARTSQVLLGTYARASEAMNIKSLKTMIMASPRKKIEQSTGRILRTRKDEREVQPLIVDVVDICHDVYAGQWSKRKAYYKKCAYAIEVPKDATMTEFVAEKEKKGADKSKSAVAKEVDIDALGFLPD